MLKYTEIKGDNMFNVFKKILIIILIIPSLLIIGCDDSKKDDGEIDEPNQEIVENIQVVSESVKERYDYETFDISSIQLEVIYTNKKETINLSLNMLSNDDLTKLSTMGSHLITINYLEKTTSIVINLVDKVKVTFMIDGRLFEEYEILRGDSFKDLPKIPNKDSYTGYWKVEEDTLNNITEDKVIEAYYINHIDYKIEDVVSYLDQYLNNLVVNQNVYLDKYIGDCQITWSSDSLYLSSDGVFDRPYQEEYVNLKAHITDGVTFVNASYTLKLPGYRNIDDKIASGYVYRNYGGLTDNFYDTMDVIYCAFMLIDTDGDFIGKDAEGMSIETSNASTKAKIKNYIVPKARKAGSYVIASLGGGGDAPTATFRVIAASDELRKKFAANVVELINELDLDGIDVDWETPRSSEAKNFTLLMEELYNAVKKNNPNHLVTAAIGGGTQGTRYDLGNSGKYLDYVNLMTYSFSSSGGTYQNALYSRSGYHNTTYNVGRTYASIDQSVRNMNNYGIPNEKLIIGVAFYGMVQSYNNGRWNALYNIDYDIIKLYLEQNTYDYYYDEVAQVPYAISKTGKEFISFDDSVSIKAKSDYVINNQLAGVMFWETGGDTSDELILAMKAKLN